MKARRVRERRRLTYARRYRGRGYPGPAASRTYAWSLLVGVHRLGQRYTAERLPSGAFSLTVSGLPDGPLAIVQAGGADHPPHTRVRGRRVVPPTRRLLGADVHRPPPARRRGGTPVISVVCETHRVPIRYIDPGCSEWDGDDGE